MPTRSGRRGERAAESLEFVIATPAVLLVLLVVVGLGLWQYAQHVAQAAAHQAAAAASLQDATADDGRAQGDQVLRRMASTLVAHPTVTVTRGATTVRAEVSGSMQRLIPFVDLPVHAVDEEPVEGFSRP